MAKVFLSHSSLDKEFVRKIVTDLKACQHEPWVDEEQIKPGDSIVAKVNQGLLECDYVIIVLSKNAVSSGWFKAEWEAKLYQEYSRGRTMVIPVMLEDCEIPAILKPKKYADFRQNHTKGMHDLLNALNAVIEPSKPELQQLAASQSPSAITSLLIQVQSPDSKLSQCLASGLEHAIRSKDAELEKFCRLELKSWEKINDSEMPSYRLIHLYLSLGQINMSSWHWTGINSIFQFMRENPKQFFPRRSFVRQSVPQLESEKVTDPDKGMLTIKSIAGEVLADASPDFANVPCWLYGRADAFQDVLSSIRHRFTELLLERLPNTQS